MKRRLFIQNKRFNIQNYANKYYSLRGNIIFVPTDVKKTIDDNDVILYLVAKLLGNSRGLGKKFWLPGFITLPEVAKLKPAAVPDMSKYNVKDTQNYCGKK